MTVGMVCCSIFFKQKAGGLNSMTLFFFDYCKRNFSKNVALLRNYGLYDFTVLVRKDV